MRSSRILAIESKYIVKEDPIEEGPEETVSIFFSANEPKLDDVVNSVNVAIEQFNHYNYVKKLLTESKEVSSHTFSFLKKEIIKSNNYLGFDDSVSIAKEDYHYTNSRTLALEGVGSFLKKIWQSIVDGFKWIVNKVKNFFGFGERNTNNIRDLEKKLDLVNREINEIIRGFPDVNVGELQQYHSLLISDECKDKNRKMFDVYQRLQRYSKIVKIHYPSTTIENAFEFNTKELQLAIGNVTNIVGNKSPTSVFIKALSGMTNLEEALKNQNIKEFSVYQDYVRNLSTSKDALKGMQGVITYDKNDKIFSNLNISDQDSKIVYCIPFLLSETPFFISLDLLETTLEDSSFKDKVLLLKARTTDTSNVNEDSYKGEQINIVTPNTLLSMTKQFSSNFAKCSKALDDVDKEVPDIKTFVSNLQRLDSENVKIEFTEVLGIVLRIVNAYETIGRYINMYYNNLTSYVEDYFLLCTDIYKNAAMSTDKTDLIGGR